MPAPYLLKSTDPGALCSPYRRVADYGNGHEGGYALSTLKVTQSLLYASTMQERALLNS